MEEMVEAAEQAWTPHVLKMINEAWRLRLGMEQARRGVVDDDVKKRADHAAARFDKQFWQAVEACGLAVQSPAGHRYEEGLPADPINLMDFGPDEMLFIEQVLRPVIKVKDAPDVLQRATVVLGRIRA
ncbi:hypothetical protein [uncultured Selenomonas sp.]|uniref:hypothetical protein n=1 Tax=uncultured Selenomonas sp. TaxID=159275 RepID=UPI0025D29C3D|nr:hypothetical protein [uncultured Selenomonas sp.]